MNYMFDIKPAKTIYSTREQLYALCVLMCWVEGIALSNDALDQDTVTLCSRDKGNTGLSAYLLETNPNVTDVMFQDAPSLPEVPIFFKVLGVPLEVTFNESGVGLVRFTVQS